MIWLSLSHAAALLEISERRLRDRIGEFTTRENGKAANGKPIKEILLESLPIDAQQKYFDDLTSPAPTPAGDAEGGSEDASSSPGAPAPTPSAPNQGRDEGRGSSGGSSEHSTLAGLSEQHLAELNDLADALRAFGHSTPDPRPLPLLGMSPSTIRRKLRALQKHGLAGLARKVRADRGRARVADEKVVARIKAEYLKPYRPFATNIYKEIAKDYEMSNAPAPSYSFVLRKTKEIDPDLVARFRHGEREFDDKFAYVTLRQKPALPRQWCDADHHIMDHLVIFDDGSIGRPWLTAIQDICTDEITGYVLSREKRTTYPGARAIGLTLRKAVLKKADPAWPSFGLFENFYADLGKDFRGQYIRAVCHDLGTTIRHTRGYHGKSKPIERFFGVLEAGLKRLPGYVGRSPETNPLKQDIGAGRDWESMRGEILTIDQFEAALYRWITAEFHHAESRALRGLSPLGALETHVKNGWQPREVASERALDLLLMNRSAKKVQRFGIQLFSSLHTQRYFMAPELVGLINQEVEVFWNPENIGEVIVYKDNRFVCKAQNRELLNYGATEEDLRRERDLKREQKSRVQERHQQLLMQAQYPDAMARAVAEGRRESVMEEERQKVAVGAEAKGVTVMMPKYQQAAKKLNAVNVTRDRGRTNAIHEHDDLKSSDELFVSEKNPWTEEDE